MVCFRCVIVNTLHKVDNKGNNNNNNNNNTINYLFSTVFFFLTVVNPQTIDKKRSITENRLGLSLMLSLLSKTRMGRRVDS